MKSYTTVFSSYLDERTIEQVSPACLSDIVINDNEHYQTHMGFGGAFTEASSYIFSLLNREDKQRLINAYFSNEGLRYSFGRLTIGSCDFSTKEYDYANKEDLSDFSLDNEPKYIKEFVDYALKENKLTFVASSWSPPSSYKTNGEKCHGGQLKEDHYSLYAEYLAKYVLEQRKRGINIEYLTIQNEPQATQTWESCIFTSEEEVRLAKEISEQFKKCNSSIKLLLWDHNRDIIAERVEGYALADSSFLNYVDGFAYHWYDKGDSDKLSIIHNKYPDKTIMFTEGCIELLNLNPEDPKQALGTIANAYRYAKNYILDSLNYSQCFIDWNLLLDENGGPNHVGNFCESLIQYDTQNKQLIFNPSYYVVKHFSHFIDEGATRIGFTNKTDVLLTSYKNKDQSIVVILLNEGDEKLVTVEVYQKKYQLKLPKCSLVTLKEEKSW